ncbi:heat-inducible transcriptional repressor HrcA [Methylococcus sp. ANG]|uniref:heat-inducible transcriptional repressor HrcA n=1 Tax=Methylococcus sp. ANG TaxID=3231903 RepID=UPI00345AECC4
MASFPELSERAQHLLKALVERYIGEGQPVGSRVLARDAGLSPATIRNVMADLEELGLITSPHTSAGRLPTVSGYRLFVDSLLTVKPLQQGIVDQLWLDLESRDNPRDLLEAASKLLSELTHMACIISMPRREALAFQHIEFLPLSDHRVLAILVTSDQEIHNKIIHTPHSFSAAELQAAANFFNAVCGGKDMASAREHLRAELENERNRLSEQLLQAGEIAEQALLEGGRSKKPFLVRGETNLMDFVELADVDRLRGLFEAFRQKESIVGLLDRCLDSPGVKILIGEESGFRPLEPCSLVTASYSVDDRVVGVLGVIGPTRMKYERVIPLVDVTAKLVGAALNQRTLAPT